jgi:hypothetical protein
MVEILWREWPMLKAPKWYLEPEPVCIAVPKDRVKRSPLGNEVVIYCDINGDVKSAVVPVKAFNEATATVLAS